MRARLAVDDGKGHYIESTIEDVELTENDGGIPNILKEYARRHADDILWMRSLKGSNMPAEAFIRFLPVSGTVSDRSVVLRASDSSNTRLVEELAKLY